MEQQKGSTSKEMIWALRWSVALRTFYRQILSLLYSSFPFGNFRPRLVRALLVYLSPCSSLYTWERCLIQPIHGLLDLHKAHDVATDFCYLIRARPIQRLVVWSWKWMICSYCNWEPKIPKSLKTTCLLSLVFTLLQDLCIEMIPTDCTWNCQLAIHCSFCNSHLLSQAGTYN